MGSTTTPRALSAAEIARRAMFADYASKAGRAAQASGRAHHYTSNEAKHWGRLGGQCAQENRRRRTRVPPAGR